jgi:uncharacterized protein
MCCQALPLNRQGSIAELNHCRFSEPFRQQGERIMSEKALPTLRERIESAKVIETSGQSLRMQLYVVTSIAKSLDAVKQNLPEHRAYLRELEDKNILFGAGPLWTDDGQYFEGDGLLIYRANSVGEAYRPVQADPMHQSGARTFTIRPWLLNDGKITVQVTLSEPQRSLL